MATASDELVYGYRFSSLIQQDRIRFAAAVNAPATVVHGIFFDGHLAYPRETATMLLAGVDSIREVVLFPTLRPEQEFS